VRGQATKIKNQSLGLEFNWASKIPVPLDPKWDSKSLLLEKFSERYNSYQLKISGILGKTVEVQGHGQTITNTSSSTLATGIIFKPPSLWPQQGNSSQLPFLITALRKQGSTHYISRNTDIPQKVQELEKSIRELVQPVEIAVQCKAK
jgi:hypothetical protein